MPQAISSGTSFIDLFSGAGGFSWGWREAGFSPAAAIDNNVPALRSHEVNFSASGGLALNRDLATLDPMEVRRLIKSSHRNIFAVIGGPPCQGWSSVGRGKIKSLHGAAMSLLDDPRNKLYRRFLEFVAAFKAPVCVMENVPGMLSVEGINVADAVVQNMDDIGYTCTYAKVNARWFGVPQDRQRLIFLGVRRASGIDVDMSGIRTFARRFRREALRLRAETTVRNALSDLPTILSGEGEDPIPYAPPRGRRSEYIRLMRQRSNGLLTDHITRSHNDQDLAAFSSMEQGAIYADLDPQYKRYRDDIFKDKYRRLLWDRVSWTVTAHLAKDGYSHIHPGQPRTLSIREAARLQSFPDDFRFFGNHGDRFRQIGNAVPPLMAWGIAEYVRTGVAKSGS